MVGAFMEVLTILGRNILKKKGIFICIVLLSILIVSAFLSILGVKSSYEQGYDR
jgi:capsular polysaccharide biosynthesis protein